MSKTCSTDEANLVFLKKGGDIVQQFGAEEGGLALALRAAVKWSADSFMELNGRAGKRGVKLNFSEDPSVHGVVG